MQRQTKQALAFTSILLVLAVSFVVAFRDSGATFPETPKRVICQSGYVAQRDTLPCVPRGPITYHHLTTCPDGYTYVNYDPPKNEGIYYEACVKDAIVSHLCLMPSPDAGYMNVDQALCVNTGEPVTQMALRSYFFAQTCVPGGYDPCWPDTTASDSDS